MRALVFGFLMIFSVSAMAVKAQPNKCEPATTLESEVLKGGGDVWPWGNEMPFPWKGIQGVWEAQMGSCTTYFTFTTTQKDNGVNQLRVKQYDPKTCKLLSRGVGYEQERYVKAALVGKDGTFTITVHRFKTSDVKSSEQRYIEGKTATVLNIGKFGKASEIKAYQLYRVDTDPESVCQ